MRSLLRAASIVASRFGSPPSSVLNIVPSMQQAPSSTCQVSVKVLASLVSADDLSYIRGTAHFFKPSPSGGDVAGSSAVGIVTEVGDGVHNLSSGDHVLLIGNRGCWTDSVLAHTDNVIKLPGALSNPSQAAALPLLLSARAILQLPGDVKRPQGDVLLAKDLDPALALAIETVGRYDGVKVTRDVSASRGVSLAVSSRGGRAATDVIRRLGTSGVLVVVPTAQLEDHNTNVSFPIAKAIFAGVSVHGFSLPAWIAQRKRADAMLQELWHAMDAGDLGMHSLETFQLSSIHRAVDAAEVSGASILLVADT